MENGLLHQCLKTNLIKESIKENNKIKNILQAPLFQPVQFVYTYMSSLQWRQLAFNPLIFMYSTDIVQDNSIFQYDYYWDVTN